MQNSANAADQEDRPAQTSPRTCSNVKLERVEPGIGEESYRHASGEAVNRKVPADPENWDRPEAVIQNPMHVTPSLSGWRIRNGVR